MGKTFLKKKILSSACGWRWRDCGVALKCRCLALMQLVSQYRRAISISLLNCQHRVCRICERCSFQYRQNEKFTALCNAVVSKLVAPLSPPMSPPHLIRQQPSSPTPTSTSLLTSSSSLPPQSLSLPSSPIVSRASVAPSSLPVRNKQRRTF